MWGATPEAAGGRGANPSNRPTRAGREAGWEELPRLLEVKPGVPAEVALQEWLADSANGEVDRAASGVAFVEFLAAFRASLVILSGVARGAELPLDQPRVTLGRGPGVDVCFDDPEMSRAHVAIEFSAGCFRLRGLAEGKPLFLNGGEIASAELKSEDRFRLGAHTFQFLLEERRFPAQ